MTPKPYYTIERITEGVLVIKKSRFICNLYPIESADEATEYILRQSKKYSDATHNCYAYVLINTERYSDDNEPQGTAGPAMLSLLKQKKLSGILAVCTRYFGGIKLGTGGLQEAYRGSVIEALNNANIVQMQYSTCGTIITDYQGMNAINRIDKNLLTVQKIEYSDLITIHFSAPFEQYEAAVTAIQNVTNGKAVVNKTCDKYTIVR